MNGLFDIVYIIYLMREFVFINNWDEDLDCLVDIVENRFFNVQVEKVKMLDEIID